MLFKEAITLRILELCNKYNYTPNKLAELSAIAPSTLRALLANNVDNPSSTIIFKIYKTLKIERFISDWILNKNNLYMVKLLKTRLKSCI